MIGAADGGEPAGVRGDADGAGRAQTAIDYGIGVGVFLLVVAFVFAFMPSMFAPFTSTSGDELVVADRSADYLTSDLLIEEAGRSVVLNATCTEAFFDTAGSDPAGCRFDEDAANLESALGVERPGVRLNVTVRNGSSGVRELDGTRLVAGGRPGPSADVLVARRSVLLDGEQNRVVVRVW